MSERERNRQRVKRRRNGIEAVTIAVILKIYVVLLPSFFSFKVYPRRMDGY